LRWFDEVLKVDGVTAGYGNAQVIFKVNLEVESQSLVVIVGPNGSGKSTLIKSVVGFTTTHGGRILFDGRNITGMPVEARVRLGLGYAPQVDNVFPNLTIEENLRMGGYLLGKKELESSIDSVFKVFPFLEERRNQLAGTLSGGERQMLALASCLITKPKMVLLDEPTAQLAPMVASKIFDKIVEIKKAGTPILLVEQNARRALEIADKAYVMVAGKIMFTGKGEEVLSRSDLGEIFLGRL
jgi:ABC-type branched-subunit amino acid transport system ATPase component